MNDVPDGIAVITGASSGIGLEIARELAGRGYDLILCAEDAAIEGAAQELVAAGATAQAVRADLTTTDGLEALVSAVRAAGRPLDVLALNAGIANAGPFLETPLEDDLAVVALDVAAVVYLAKRLLPAMVERGAGRVLITSSVAALMPGPNYATYAASKSFELSFAEAVRHELRDTGVTITALMPGPTETPFFEDNDMDEMRITDTRKDDAAKVAREAVEGLLKGDDKVVVRSLKAKMQAALGAVLPQRAGAAVHSTTTKRKGE
jgi:short-subunit dehydrogenase